jgi:hypothetical protein
MKRVLDVYVDFMAEALHQQQGIVDLKSTEIALLSRKIVLRDIKAYPTRIFSTYCSFFIHNLNLIDYKGLQSLPLDRMWNIHSSMASLMTFSLLGQHTVLDQAQAFTGQTQTPELAMLSILKTLETKLTISDHGVLSKNILAECVQVLLVSSVLYSGRQ